MAWHIDAPVIVPFDFSDHSRAAFQRALQITDPENIHVVHVLPVFTPTEPGVGWGLIDDAQRFTQANKGMSDETAKQIDAEVRRIIDECYKKAQDILEENVDKLHVMADALMQYETIDSEQIDDIMEGRTPREPSDWSSRDGDGSGSGSAPATDSETPDRSGPIGGPAGEH